MRPIFLIWQFSLDMPLWLKFPIRNSLFKMKYQIFGIDSLLNFINLKPHKEFPKFWNGWRFCYRFSSFPNATKWSWNQLFYEIHDNIFLYITEIQLSTSPWSWIYRDGSPVTWFKWLTGQPSHQTNEMHVFVAVFSGALQS